MNQAPLLEVDGLEVHFPLRGSFGARLLGRSSGAVQAVDGVSFSIGHGEVLGVVGESGSGKTTLGRALLRLVDPTAGAVRLEGRDVAAMNERDVRAMRKEMQMVFQDPHASLNPAMTLETAVGHPLKIHGVSRDRTEIRRRVSEVLERVGLAPADQYLGKFPSDLSGSGKTTLGRALLRLVDPTAGAVRLEGRDVAAMNERDVRAMRKEMQMVFQDPHASLNPAMTLETAVGHPLRIHGITRDRTEIRRRVSEVLERVGLAPADQYLGKFPSDLSGGQKQRAVLARAVILGPRLLVADEPISMLDMSVRAKILELMLGLKRDFDLTYLYITHDLATAKFFCDRVAIMYLGRIVEIGATDEIFANPRHPYTESLLRAIPDPDPSAGVPRNLPRGEVPDAAMPPLGCRFHPRCPRAFEVCGWESRDLHDLIERRWAKGGPERFEAERPVLGDVTALDQPVERVRIAAGSGRTGEQVAELLAGIRKEEADEKLWTGVRSIEADASSAEVVFHHGSDPALRPEGGVEVACHLYDPEAIDAAAEARAGG